MTRELLVTASKMEMKRSFAVILRRKHCVLLLCKTEAKSQKFTFKFFRKETGLMFCAQECTWALYMGLFLFLALLVEMPSERHLAMLPILSCEGHSFTPVAVL